MLEQVGEAALARRLVGGADVVPDVDRDLREPVVLAEDDREPVGELVLLERYGGVLDRDRGGDGELCKHGPEA